MGIRLVQRISPVVFALLASCELVHPALGREDVSRPDIVFDHGPLDTLDVVPEISPEVVEADVVDAFDAVEVIDVADVPDVPLPPDAGPIIWTADFSGLAPGPANLAAFGLSFERMSVATVQLDAARVAPEIASNIPRVGSDGRRRGLVLEESRTNLVLQNRAMTSVPPWTAGTGAMTPDFVAGPDGMVLAERCNVPSAGFSNYHQFTGTAVPYALSTWARATAGSVTGQMGTSNGVTNIAMQAPLTVAWSRLSLVRTMTAAPTCNIVPVDCRGGIPGGTAASRDACVDLTQVEAGAWASEAIVTAGAPATRAGERLAYGAGATLVDGGRLSLAFVLQPKGARSEYTNPMRLWTFDAMNFAEIAPATGALTVVIGGVSSAAPMITWNAGDTLELFVAAGGGIPSLVAYRTNGGTATENTFGSLAALAPTGALDLLCNGATSQFSAWVTSITAYRSGIRPF